MFFISIHDVNKHGDFHKWTHSKGKNEKQKLLDKEKKQVKARCTIL